MKTLFRNFIGICCILSIFSFFPPAFAADVQFVTIGTAAPGGTFYVLGVGIADVINKNLKDANFKATAITTGGALENLRLLGGGKIQVGLSNIRSHTKAYLGKRPFKKTFQNIRKGFNIGIYVLHLVTIEKTGIKTIYDLRGKTVSFGTSGSIVQAVGKYLLKLHGIDIKDVKRKYIGPAEAVDALTDGIIDAFAQYSVLTSPAVKALSARKTPVLVACDREKLDIAQKTEKFLSFTIPGGTYKGQGGDVPALAVIGSLDFNVNDSTDFVYQITKAIIENKDHIKRIHPIGDKIRLLTKEEAAISPVPFHPGVLKYANEVGVKY